MDLPNELCNELFNHMNILEVIDLCLTTGKSDLPNGTLLRIKNEVKMLNYFARHNYCHKPGEITRCRKCIREYESRDIGCKMDDSQAQDGA